MAEFVSKSIDNLSHGLTVKGAMEKLKLREWVPVPSIYTLMLTNDPIV
jgi:hypothetical protein